MPGEWLPVRVVVQSPSGGERGGEGALFEPEAGDGDIVVPILIAGGFLLTAFIFPPCLLFNIPILLLRSAISQARRDSANAVRVAAFECAACGAKNPSIDRAPAFPVSVACVACGAGLAIRRAPRRNLVDEPEGQVP